MSDNKDFKQQVKKKKKATSIFHTKKMPKRSHTTYVSDNETEEKMVGFEEEKLIPVSKPNQSKKGKFTKPSSASFPSQVASSSRIHQHEEINI